MRNGRYRLIDGGLLRRLMVAPAPGGERHTVRSLATAAGVSKSKVQTMIQGRQTVDVDTAERVAEAVSAERSWLFTPASFTFMNENYEEVEPDDDARSAEDARPDGCAHELELHDGPSGPDGGRNEVEPLDAPRDGGP